jgi:broad specificity phosphatase PhoE
MFGQKHVSVIVSHNTRIQCLLDSFHRTEKIRFQNCVILKLEIGSTLKLSMVYSGELSNKERAEVSLNRRYYVKDPQEVSEGYVLYNPTITVHDFTQIRNSLKLPFALKENYIFYIVRHGQALHNQKMYGISTTLGMKLDTPLTEEGPQSGVEQAKRAGVMLKRELQKTGNHVTNFFVSDLNRTHQTSQILQNSIGHTNKAIVLPCAHELSEKGDIGNCDEATSNVSITNKLSRENYSSCKASDGLPAKHCSKLDWESVYLPFYGDKVRGQEDTITGYITFKRHAMKQLKQQCRNTTMIAMAIYYISHRTHNGNPLSVENYISSQFGGTKRKKRKGKKTMHKRT